MIKFIICEDNQNFLQKITEELNKIMMPVNHEYKIFRFKEYNEELQNIMDDPKDEKIYILDVEMPEISGLEIASEIREIDEESTIIFLTSHPECKNDVFYSRLLALDYIHKGKIWKERFNETIKYVLKRINKKKILRFDFQANSYRIPLEKINYVEKVQSLKKCLIHTTDGKVYPITRNLTGVEKMLSEAFYKSHKSFIINIENIKHIDYTENKVIFNNNESEYLISNRNKKALKEYIDNYK